MSQLIWGPLSHRYGRRPVLLAGLGGYTLAAIGSTLAPSMESLVLWRAVQGVADAVVTRKQLQPHLVGGHVGVGNVPLQPHALEGLHVGSVARAELALSLSDPHRLP